MEDLLKLIRERQSSRTPFDADRPLTKHAIGKIVEAAMWAPTAHNMQNFEVIVVDNEYILDEIRKIEFPVSETFLRENYLQLSFSVDELKKKKTGVLGTMFPKSWLHPVFVPGHEDDEEHPLLERHNTMLTCPCLMMLLYDPSRRAPASEGDFLGVMSLGCVLENMWLMAAHLGIGFHVVSSLSEPSAAKALKQLLRIPDHLSIALSFRLGHPVANPHYLRVRRDPEDFVHFNEYGNKETEDELDHLNQ